MYLTRGSTGFIEPGAGFHDTDGCGVLLNFSSTLVAPNANFDNNGREDASAGSIDLGAIKGQWQSIVTAPSINVTNPVGSGVVIIGGSVATIRGATITGAGDKGVLAGGVSQVHARSVDVTLCDTGLYAAEGALMRLIQSNISDNTANGVVVSGGAVVNSATGTTINNNGNNGIIVSGGGRFIIASPTITGNGLDGILVEDGDAVVSSGTISGNGSDDLSVNGPGLGIIRISGSITTTSGNSAANNISDSNVAAFNVFTRSGTGGIFGRGGKSSNRGGADIASGATNVTVTHGLGSTPVNDEINVLPQESLGSATQYWISNVTATTFRINVDIAPGKVLTFGWNIVRIFG